MRRFRIVTHYGRHMVAGGIIPAHILAAGQTWAAASGADHAVTITKIEDDWVTYKDGLSEHEKDVFSFQCRYCLVVAEPKLPKELM